VAAEFVGRPAEGEVPPYALPNCGKQNGFGEVKQLRLAVISLDCDMMDRDFQD
jgi:hypothetical protein